MLVFEPDIKFAPLAERQIENDHHDLLVMTPHRMKFFKAYNEKLQLIIKFSTGQILLSHTYEIKIATKYRNGFRIYLLGLQWHVFISYFSKLLKSTLFQDASPWLNVYINMIKTYAN